MPLSPAVSVMLAYDSKVFAYDFLTGVTETIRAQIITRKLQRPN